MNVAFKLEQDMPPLAQTKFHTRPYKFEVSMAHITTNSKVHVEGTTLSAIPIYTQFQIGSIEKNVKLSFNFLIHIA